MTITALANPDDGRRMSHEEAVYLCRWVKSASPHQAIDELTPDAWSELLGDLPLADCKDAAARVLKAKPFVAPSEIREQVGLIRRQRMNAFGLLPDPPRDLSDEDYSPWLRRLNQRIADGDLRNRAQYFAEIGEEDPEHGRPPRRRAPWNEDER